MSKDFASEMNDILVALGLTIVVPELDPDIELAAPNRPPDPDPPKETLSFRTELRNYSLDSITMEFQMTIQPKVRLTPKTASILLMVLVGRANSSGVDIAMYLSMSYLLELCKRYLHGPKDNVNLEKTARVCTLAELTLLALSKDGWQSLSSFSKPHPKVSELIFASGWMPDRRTWASWNEFFRPEQLLELRIVPLEQFQERESNTERYSSYTKGYSESGKGYRRDGKVYGQDTGPRAQEPVPVPEGYEEFSHPLAEDPTYQRLNALILET